MSLTGAVKRARIAAVAASEAAAVLSTVRPPQKRKMSSDNGPSAAADVPPVPPLQRHGSSRVTDPSSNSQRATLQRQDSLPKMPPPTLESVLTSYMATATPILTPEETASAQAACDAFMQHDGPRLYEKFLEHHEETTNYIEDFYREIYTGATCSNYSLNPNFVLFPKEGCDTASSRAADLTMSALQYWYDTHAGTLPVMETRKGSLCMRQMPWLFGSARIATSAPFDAMECHIDTSKHIVVMCRGLFYKLTVLNEDGSLAVSPELLQQRFDEIQAAAAAVADPVSGAVGALTTAERTTWAPERERLAQLSETNVAAFTTVDQALFIVSIDDVSGLSIEDQERNVLYGLESTVHNRWMDKYNIIVCADGNAGLNWEHSMLDGHTMMEFYAAVGAGYDANAPVNPSPEVAAIEPVTWELDATTASKISGAVGKSLELTNNIGVSILEYPTFGSTFIKGCKCSPDGFTQAAFTLAYYEQVGSFPSPYESVLTKAFKHGRVSVARNMSTVIADGVLRFRASEDPNEKIAAFREIVTEVSRICATAARAQEFDRPFLALRKIAENEGMPFSVVEDPAWAKLNHLHLVTSHCGKPPIRLFGYEPPSSDGFSVGYFVTPNNMQMAITHFDKAAAAQFKTTMSNQLDMLKALFESQLPPPPAP